MDRARKGIVDILALFQSEDSRGFLASKADLQTFLQKVASIENPSGKISVNDATVFEMIQKIIRCTCGVLSKWVTDVIESSSDTDCLLSMDDSLNVTKLLKCLCVFFLEPFLEVPVTNTSADKIPVNRSLSVREKLNLLLENMNALCSISEKNLIFQKILMDSCSLYCLTTLLQLCFSPSAARNFDKLQRQNCLKFLNILTTSWLTNDRLIKDTIVIQSMSARNAPPWLVKKCGTMMTRILLSENGIKTVILSLVANFDDNSDVVGESWERVVALSSIISTLPNGGTAVSYCNHVCPQIVKLLAASRENETPNSKDVIRIAVTTLHALHEKYPAESQQFEAHLCKSLLQYTQGFVIDTNSNMWADLIECIQTLHQICVSVGMAPSSLIFLLLKPYVKILFHIFIKIPASSFLISQILDLLNAFLRKSDESVSANIIMAMFCQGHGDVKSPDKSLYFIINEEGNVTVTRSFLSDPSDLLQELDRKVKFLLDMITQHENLAGNVLLLLLENLCNPGKNDPIQIDANKLLTSSERATEAMELNEERFITFGLLTSILESCDPNSLLSNNRQILEFVKATVLDLPKKFSSNVDDSVEMLKMCVSVVGICMLSDLDSIQRRSLQDIVPGLKCILDMDGVLDNETKELVSDLVIAISTYGAANDMSVSDFSDTMTKYLKNMSSADKTDQQPDFKDMDCSDSTIKVRQVDDTTNFHNETLTVNKHESNVASNMSKSVSEAMEDIYSTSPALKGGSVRYLTKCITENMPSVVSKITTLIDLFMGCLKDDDSFVYLSAVQGLAVISASCGAHLQEGPLLERIVEEFLDNDKLNSVNGVFCKMKLGEVIIRIIRDMGDMAPSHASRLLPMLLKLSRHSDSVMRASALSNFAELAPMAPEMLSTMQFEIRDCLCGVAISDVDSMVRRSAVYAIRCMVERLSNQFLRVFPETVKDMYRVLKKLYVSDEDHAIQLHAQLALEELDTIMKSAIFKPPDLKKKISILP